MSEFKIVIPNPDDSWNPVVAEVEQGSGYYYIEGVDLNQVRFPRDFDLNTWIQLLRELHAKFQQDCVAARSISS